MNRQTPASQTYLITGGAGFVGSHLAEHLLQIGHRVLVIDDLSTGSTANIESLRGHERFAFTYASVTDSAVLDRLAAQADVIVHLAAAVGVRLVVEQPARTIEINVMGAEAVLKAAHRHGCRVMLASSSEVYGKGCRVPFHEDDDVLLGPTRMSRWSYAASKMVDEFLGLAYHQQHQLPVTIFRLFNTVGPRQTGRYGMVVPRMVRQAVEGADITVYGDGSQSRCFCHVHDVVRAIVGLAQSPEAIGQVYNIGSTEEVTVLQLARHIRDMADSASKIIFVPYEQAYAPGFQDMHRRVPDIGRIAAAIGWQPSRRLEQTVREVIDIERARAAATSACQARSGE